MKTVDLLSHIKITVKLMDLCDSQLHLEGVVSVLHTAAGTITFNVLVKTENKDNVMSAAKLIQFTCKYNISP